MTAAFVAEYALLVPSIIFNAAGSMTTRGTTPRVSRSFVLRTGISAPKDSHRDGF